MKNWSRRTWIVVASVVVMAVLGVVGVVVFALGSGGPVSRIDVTGLPKGSTFTVRAGSDAPDVDATGIKALGGAYDISVKGAAAGAQVRARLDRSKLPKGEPSCARPTTAINLGIEVLNPEIGEWMPLPTTCAGDTLTATAPHFSQYRVVEAVPGTYTFDATLRAGTVSVQTSERPDESVFDFTVKSIDAAVNRVIQNATGTVRPGALECSPVGARQSIRLVGPPQVSGCVVAGAGGNDEFRLQNALNVPISVTLPPGSERWLEPVEEGGLPDISEMLASIAAKSRGQVFVPALGVARFTITDDAPNPFLLNASMDDTTLGLDIFLAALGPLGKRMWPRSKELPDLLRQVGERLDEVIKSEGRAALNPARVREIIKQVFSGRVGWNTFTSGIESILDIAQCVRSPFTTADDVAKADLRCTATILKAAGQEVVDVLDTAADDLNLARTVNEDFAVNVWTSLTGRNLTATTFKIGLPPVLPDPVQNTTPTVPPTPPCKHSCGGTWGDPHLITFDGGHYDFQQVGEFTAVKSTTDDLEIQVRQAPFQSSPSIACNQAVALRVAGHRVGIYLTDSGELVLLDGKAVTAASAPIPLPGGGTLTYPPNSPVQTVTWPDGTVATVDNNYRAFLALDVSLAQARTGHVLGLLGNANGQPADDLTTSTGTVLPDPAPQDQIYGAYSQGWRVTTSSSIFDYARGQSTATFTDVHFPYAQTSLDTLPAANRAAATQVCRAAGIPPGPTLDACILDVAVSGDPSLATAAAVAGLSRAKIIASSSVGEPWTDPQRRSGTAVLIYGNLACSAVDANQACTGGLWPMLPNAPWIWAHQAVVDGQSVVTFTATVNLDAAQAAQPLRLTAAADDSFVAKVNGAQVATGGFQGPLSSVLVRLRPGVNTLSFTVTNVPGFDPFANPAGLAWELTAAD